MEKHKQIYDIIIVIMTQFFIIFIFQNFNVVIMAIINNTIKP
jgi:hypothetical protein